MLHEGDTAPEIQLETDTGEPFQLSKHKGRKVVLYFFPKADTSGCTTEARDFRDSIGDFAKKGAQVFGISPDPPRAQARFKEKNQIPFTLLCDVDRSAAQAFGVYKEKNMYGRTVLGIERTTYVIDERGKIEKVFSRVRPAGHAKEVLSVL